MAAVDRRGTPSSGQTQDATEARPRALPTAAPATDHDWRRLEVVRFCKGWELAALAVGLAPVAGLKKLSGAEVETYKLILSAVNANVTASRTKSKLQCEIESPIGRVATLPPSLTLVGTNLKFDLLKFEKFFADGPMSESLHPKFREVAEAVRNRVARQLNRRPKTSASGEQKTANKQAELLLGLAVLHYDYGFGRDVRGRTPVTSVAKEMRSDLDALGIKGDVKTISGYLQGAADRIVSEAGAQLEQLRRYFAEATK